MNYPEDKLAGTLIALWHLIGACCFAGIFFFAGAVFKFFSQNVDQQYAPPALGVIALVISIVGFAVIGFYLLGFIGGLGIAAGRKWAFDLVLVIGIIRMILHIGNLPHGIVFMAIDGLCVYYCYQRLSGKLGPRPLR